MNNLVNRVSMIGRVGANPNMTLHNGNVIARFDIAVDAGFQDKNGQWHNQTHWHVIKAWGKTAELVQKYLQKGQKVMIEGKLIHREHEKSGGKQMRTEIEIHNFLVLTNT